ncbi:MAG: glycosyltransferase family 9 protein [Candidatus Binatia bacterium]|jgi:heptosyltransferase III
MSEHFQPVHESALLLFPGALGDFICFLPTLVELRARHPGHMLVVAKPALLDLVRPLQVATASIDGRAVASLFSSSLLVTAETKALLAGFDTAYSWTGFGDPDVVRHLAALTGGRVNTYRFRGMDQGEHAVDYYARCAGVTPSKSIAESVADDANWFATVQRQRRLGDSFAVIHAGSGSPRKNWLGFAALVRWWQRRARSPVVLLRGPAEAERSASTDCGADVVLEGLTLPQVATLLRRARLYVGNDSGISHLAGAVGVAGLALFGPTDPSVWAPRGPHLQTLHAPEPCRQCGPEVFCVHRLPVDSVLGAVDRCTGR